MGRSLRLPSWGGEEEGSGPWPGPQVGSGEGWEAGTSVQLTHFPGLGWAPCPFRYLDTMQPAQPSRCPQAAPEPEDTWIKVLTGGCPSPVSTRDSLVPNVCSSHLHLPGAGENQVLSVVTRPPPPRPESPPQPSQGGRASSACSDLIQRGHMLPTHEVQRVWVTVTVSA